MLAIDQDPLGRQALPAHKDGQQAIMVKELEDGSKAVGLFNLTETEMTITAEWAALVLTGPRQVRDLWRQKDLGRFTGRFAAKVPAHGVVLVKLSP